jgi:hypothetical protein
MFAAEGGDVVAVSNLAAMLRRKAITEAPALERILLMLIRAETRTRHRK